MPNYKWFAKKDIDLETTPVKIRAMQTLGVPYPEGYDEIAVEDLKKQGAEIAADLKASGIDIEPTKEMVAMIAYMHKMGKDISSPETLLREPKKTTATVTTTIPETKKAPEKTKEKAVTPTADKKLLTDKADLEAGKESFAKNCVVCHGADGKGIATFPNLTDDEWLTGSSPEEVVKSISEGNVAKGMIPYKNILSEKQILQVTSYILINLQEK